MSIKTTISTFAEIASKIDAKLAQRGYVLTWDFQNRKPEGHSTESIYVSLTASKGWGGSVAKTGRMYSIAEVEHWTSGAATVDRVVECIIDDLFPHVLR